LARDALTFNERAAFERRRKLHFAFGRCDSPTLNAALN
jgi:hypothetical protein